MTHRPNKPCKLFRCNWTSHLEGTPFEELCFYQDNHGQWCIESRFGRDDEASFDWWFEDNKLIIAEFGQETELDFQITAHQGHCILRFSTTPLQNSEFQEFYCYHPNG